MIFFDSNSITEFVFFFFPKEEEGKVEKNGFLPRIMYYLCIWAIFNKRHLAVSIKVSKFQNEFMKSSFLPKYERNIVRISALYCASLQGRNPYNFWFIFREKWWLHKFILKFTDLYWLSDLKIAVEKHLRMYDTEESLQELNFKLGTTKLNHNLYVCTTHKIVRFWLSKKV